MKTIYLRQKSSGNFEFSTRLNATHKFRTQKSFAEWYNENYKKVGQVSSRLSGKIIKTTYRMSQVYFVTADEVVKYIKKNNIF